MVWDDVVDTRGVYFFCASQMDSMAQKACLATFPSCTTIWPKRRNRVQDNLYGSGSSLAGHFTPKGFGFVDATIPCHLLP